MRTGNCQCGICMAAGELEREVLKKELVESLSMIQCLQDMLRKSFTISKSENGFMIFTGEGEVVAEFADMNMPVSKLITILEVFG